MQTSILVDKSPGSKGRCALKIKPTKIDRLLSRDLGLRSLQGHIGIDRDMIYGIEFADNISIAQDYAVLETLSAVRIS